jgi:hypothetical protein
VRSLAMWTARALLWTICFDWCLVALAMAIQCESSLQPAQKCYAAGVTKLKLKGWRNLVRTG